MRTILLIVLVLLLIGAFPAWPYSTGWGYYPGGGLVLLIVLILRALARVEQRFAATARKTGTATLGLLHLNDRQRKAQPQLVAEINLDVMHSELLELHAAEIMDVGRVAFHFLQFEFDFRLRDHLMSSTPTIRDRC